jgi:hypothetical protein
MMNDEQHTYHDEENIVRLLPPQCRGCDVPPEFIPVHKADYIRWRTGTHIHHAFPEMPADQRELILTSYHPACWDALWLPEEDERTKELK